MCSTVAIAQLLTPAQPMSHVTASRVVPDPGRGGGPPGSQGSLAMQPSIAAPSAADVRQPKVVCYAGSVMSSCHFSANSSCEKRSSSCEHNVGSRNIGKKNANSTADAYAFVRQTAILRSSLSSKRRSILRPDVAFLPGPQENLRCRIGRYVTPVDRLPDEPVILTSAAGRAHCSSHRIEKRSLCGRWEIERQNLDAQRQTNARPPYES